MDTKVLKKSRWVQVNVFIAKEKTKTFLDTVQSPISKPHELDKTGKRENDTTKNIEIANHRKSAVIYNADFLAP
ncbi:MAG TPA: hypothetical protein PLD88_00270, partial [Candidatus Berkiella sp.]|nr:hypothetical protein [Candidatus Berkiella sp.]